MGNIRPPKLNSLDRGWSGSKMPGRSIGPPDPIGDECFDGFDTKVLELKTIFNMKGFTYLEHDCDAGILQHTLDLVSVHYDTTPHSDWELEEMFVEQYGFTDGFKQDKNHYHPEFIRREHEIKPMHPGLMDYLREEYRENITENWY